MRGKKVKELRKAFAGGRIPLGQLYNDNAPLRASIHRRRFKAVKRIYKKGKLFVEKDSLKEVEHELDI